MLIKHAFYTAIFAVVFAACAGPRKWQDVTLVGPITTFNWPMYIAKEGDYYAKYGLNVKLVFANHPADIAMLVSGEAQVNLNTLQQAMELGAKEPSIVIYGSPLKKWLFGLIASKDVHTVADLKGKRIGVTQLGGSTYDYTARLLGEFGITPDQVQWVSLGPNSRAAALAGGRVDATMLSAPAYFDLEGAGFKSLANIIDYDDILATSVLLFKKSTVEMNPKLPELLLRAHAEAVKRFYEDKPFAIKAHLVYDKQDVAGLERVYDVYARRNAFDRVPYILSDAVKYVLDSAPDAAIASGMRKVDYRQVIENATLDRLLQQGFFLQLFGAKTQAEEEQRALIAFR